MLYSCLLLKQHGSPLERQLLNFGAEMTSQPNIYTAKEKTCTIFSSMSMMGIVDIIKKLFELNPPRSFPENFTSNTVAEKAVEAFGDLRVVRMPQLQGINALSNTRTERFSRLSFACVLQGYFCL